MKVHYNPLSTAKFKNNEEIEFRLGQKIVTGKILGKAKEYPPMWIVGSESIKNDAYLYDVAIISVGDIIKTDERNDI